MDTYEKMIDTLMGHFTCPPFKDDVEQGKAQFFERAGILDEERPDYELKMVLFTDWYLMSRPLNKFGKTPLLTAESLDSFGKFGFDLKLFANLKAQRHSLFEFVKFSGSTMIVKDLFSKYKIKIEKSNLHYGFDRGDIFESRLIPHEDSFCFSSSFCFHPQESNKYILKEIKKISKLPVEDQPQAREELMFGLFKMKNKYEQYRHVALNMIYTNEKILKF